VCHAALTLRPDVVLLDFSLSGGLEVCRRLANLTPAVSVVAFTGHNDAELKRLAREAGAAAFVWKLVTPTELLPTIHTLVERTRDQD
jgi:CheY-like chemotaxis protein